MQGVKEYFRTKSLSTLASRTFVLLYSFFEDFPPLGLRVPEKKLCTQPV